MCGSTAWFVSDLVGNPEDRFSHNKAQMKVTAGRFKLYLFNSSRSIPDKDPYFEIDNLSQLTSPVATNDGSKYHSDP